MNTLKSPQCSYRRACNVREFQIKLGYFVACLFSCIGDHNIDGHRTACLLRIVRAGKCAIRERRVTHPIAERVKRCPLKVTISAAFHRVIFESRQLADTRIESYRQTARGIVRSEERRVGKE